MAADFTTYKQWQSVGEAEGGFIEPEPTMLVGHEMWVPEGSNEDR